MRRLVRRIRPAITVWYHQHLRLVNLSAGADERIVRRYARAVGLPARILPNYRGTATSWQNHAFPGTSSFVVELPAGPLSRASARRHADAVLDAAAAGCGRVGRSDGPASCGARSRSARRAARRCAPTRAATTASTPPRCATRR